MAKKKPDVVPKNTVIVVVIIALLIGWLGGFLLASNSDVDSDSKSISNEEAMVHAHGTYELDASSDSLPSVKLLAEKDKKKGWNLTLVTENFTFAPQSVNEEVVEGEGHAHLWVDGVKTTRLYSNYYYLPELSEGDHELSVTLNTNQHDDYVVNGEIIKADINVTEDRAVDEMDTHSHSSDSKVDATHSDDHMMNTEMSN